jgi:superoxide dismutase, Fe-Mn family
VSYELPRLPYSYEALEPDISAQTLKIHHNVLQRRYVEKLNTLMGGSTVPLERLIVEAPEGNLLDMAQQVFNHTFLWHSMTPAGGGKPSRSTGLGQAMVRWGNVFQKNFVQVAEGVFGSGYVWLVADNNGEVLLWPGSDAENPLRHGFHPLLTLDVWEHSYFLDHKANRKKYVQVFLDHLVNWKFAENNYARLFGA